jgi:hypothetical protein
MPRKGQPCQIELDVNGQTEKFDRKSQVIWRMYDLLGEPGDVVLVVRKKDA